MVATSPMDYVMCVTGPDTDQVEAVRHGYGGGSTDTDFGHGSDDNRPDNPACQRWAREVR